MWRNRLLYLLVLVSSTVFFIFFDGWFGEYLWYLTLLLPWISLLLSLPAMVTARLHLEVPAMVVRDQEAVAQTRLLCKFPAPRHKLRLHLEHQPTRQRSRHRYRPFRESGLGIDLPTDHCGIIHHKLTACRICDYLGIFSIPRSWQSQGKTFILPTPAPPARMPNLDALRHGTLRPKAGGGYSELHELREYRPGDSLRNIHWKLTAKMDQPMVLEPQELQLGLVALSVELPENPDAFDQVLDETLWLSQWLLDQGYGHHVFWAQTGQVQDQAVNKPEDLPALQQHLCASFPTAPQDLGRDLCPQATWVHHVGRRKEETP